jgi:hypothetical protein
MLVKAIPGSKIICLLCVHWMPLTIVVARLAASPKNSLYVCLFERELCHLHKTAEKLSIAPHALPYIYTTKIVTLLDVCCNITTPSMLKCLSSFNLFLY